MHTFFPPIEFAFLIVILNHMHFYTKVCPNSKPHKKCPFFGVLTLTKERNWVMLYYELVDCIIVGLEPMVMILLSASQTLRPALLRTYQRTPPLQWCTICKTDKASLL